MFTYLNMKHLIVALYILSLYNKKLYVYMFIILISVISKVNSYIYVATCGYGHLNLYWSH